MTTPHGHTTDVREELAHVLADIKRRPVGELLAGDGSLEALGLDSLDLVELSVRLDQRYGVELGSEAEDFAALAGLDPLTALIERRRRR